MTFFYIYIVSENYQILNELMYICVAKVGFLASIYIGK